MLRTIETNFAFPVPGTGYMGLTKRELLAAMMLQGMLAGPWFDRNHLYERGVESAVEWADELLNALEKSEP